MSSQVDLVKLFSTVAETLQENRGTLNQADEYNQDHGDHMVEIFQLITGAMKEAPRENPAKGFQKASQKLAEKDSGSAAMYARGLSQAAEYFKGQELDATQLLPLLQTMLGGGEAEVSKTPGGLLDSLVGSFGGEDGLDMADLLSAGATFLESKQAGDSNLEAVVDAVISASKMGETPYRAQSSKLVADALLRNLLGGVK